MYYRGEYFPRAILRTSQYPVTLVAIDGRFHVESGHVSSAPFETDFELHLTLGQLFSKPYSHLSIQIAPTTADKERKAYTVKTAGVTPIVDDLCGVQVVPSEILLADPSDANVMFDPTSDGTIPRIMTDVPNDAVLTRTHLEIFRTTRIRTHYPSELPRVDETSDLNTSLILLSNKAHIRPTNVRPAHIPLHPLPESTLKEENTGLAALYQNDFSKRAKETLDSILSQNRSVGVNVLRSTADFEQRRSQHFMRLHAMAAAAAPGQSYLRPLFVLWSRYFQALFSENPIAVATPAGANAPFNFAFAAHPAQAAPIPQGNIVYLGIRNSQTKGNVGWAAQGNVPAIDPEEGFSNLGATGPDEVTRGDAALIDAAGLPQQALVELIRAFFPQTAAGASCYVGNNPAAAWAQRWNLPIAAAEIPGVDKVYIHWGQTAEDQTIPHRDLRGDVLAVDPDANTNPWPAFANQDPRVKTPRSHEVMMAINHLITLNHAGGDARTAFELVFWRLFSFKPSGSPARAGNAPSSSMPCLGATDLYLPRIRTIQAYFDTFHMPLNIPERILEVFQTRSNIIMSSAWYGALHLSQSLAWPSHTATMRGRQLTVANNFGTINAPTNPHLYRHLYQMAHVTRPEMMSGFASLHRQAHAHMFGYAPPPIIWELGPKVPAAVWAQHASIYISHPYAELWSARRLPIHMALPFRDQGPLWEANAPKPVSANASIVDKVRLGRSLAPFAGYDWIIDGGMEFSSRYFTSVPDANGQFAHEVGANPFPTYEYGVWDSPFEYEWPANPIAFPITTMQPPGALPDVMSNFILPGSLLPFDIQTWRIKAAGVRTVNTHGRANALSISRSWKALYSGRTDVGLRISVMRPDVFDFEYTPDAEYSAVMIFEESSGAFSGLGVMNATDISEIQQARSAQVALAAASTIPSLFPSYLANHNRPHQPMPVQGSRPFTKASPGGRKANTTQQPRSKPTRMQTSKPTDLPPRSVTTITPAPVLTYESHNPTDARQLPPLQEGYAHIENEIVMSKSPSPKVEYRYRDSDPNIVTMATYSEPDPYAPSVAKVPAARGSSPSPPNGDDPTPAPVPGVQGGPSRPTPFNQTPENAYFHQRPHIRDLIRLGLWDSDSDAPKKNIVFERRDGGIDALFHKGVSPPRDPPSSPHSVDMTSKRTFAPTHADATYQAPEQRLFQPSQLPALAPVDPPPMVVRSANRGQPQRQQGVVTRSTDPTAAQGRNVVPNDKDAIAAQSQLLDLQNRRPISGTSEEVLQTYHDLEAENIPNRLFSFGDIGASGAPPSRLDFSRPKNSS
jgi:hypothetical protein